MSNVLVNDTSLTAIANAIRSKLGVSTTYKPGQMASAIQSIPTGGSSAIIVDTQDSHGGTIREITTQSVVNLQPQKTVTPTSSQQTVLPDTGYDGLASVIVAAASGGGIASGTYTPASNALTATINTGLSTVNGFAMWIPSTTTQDSVRAIAFILIDVTNDFRATVGENNNHTQLWSTPFCGASRLQYTISGGNVSMTTFDSNGSGYFVTEHTYQWVAW